MKLAGSKNRLMLILLVIGIVAFMGGSMFSCETENKVVNLALKKNDKVYLFSVLGSFIVENSLEKKESPAAIGFIRLFQDDGLFVAPKEIEQIANLLGGNYALYPFKEMSYDGYVTEGEESVYEKTFKNKSTANIGEQIRENRVEITHPVTAEMYEIIWNWNPKTGTIEAVKNCEVKSFWTKTSIQPGETITSADDYVVVKLNNLVDFFNNGSKLEYNSEQELLYIISD